MFGRAAACARAAPGGQAATATSAARAATNDRTRAGAPRATRLRRRVTAATTDSLMAASSLKQRTPLRF